MAKTMIKGSDSNGISPSISFETSSALIITKQAYFATIVGLNEASGLLSNCIHYAQVMRLSQGGAIDNLCETAADREQTKKAFWFLYSIEKTFCLRAEMFPVRYSPGA
jgi:hypothetical protein